MIDIQGTVNGWGSLSDREVGMKHLMLELAEQRASELRRTRGRQRRARSETGQATHRAGVRQVVGGALVRAGERIAPPARTPATR